ncbi:MAG TPA: hypothetical protein VJ385_15260 [Fibrobacteria bacterium]|nr:hypothetical protein [Fibrobacteria bacterium]
MIGCAAAPPERPAPARPGDYAAVIAYLKRYVAHELKGHKHRAVSIALVEDQRVLWAEGFGSAP